MSADAFPPRLDRRVALKWMLTAAATLAVARRGFAAAAEDGTAPAAVPGAAGYGPDPSMVKIYRPGDVWPLTFTPAQRRAAVALGDVMIPADEESPAASAVGVPDFIDEWISAPYPVQKADRPVILNGLAWLDDEARARFGAEFAGLAPAQQTAICDDLCDPARAKPEHREAVKFFKKFRDLAAGGYYTTPEGMKAIGYTGNLPLPGFDGPPPEALRHVGLA